MAAMQQLGLAERASRGIDRMFREQVRVGQQVPWIRADEYSVEVNFSSGAPNRAFAGFVATLPRLLRENVDVMLALVHLCQRPTLTLADAARLLQVGEVEAKDRLDALGVGSDALIERDGDARRGVRWRLRSSVASALGTAVQHRARPTPTGGIGGHQVLHRRDPGAGISLRQPAADAQILAFSSEENVWS